MAHVAEKHTGEAHRIKRAAGTKGLNDWSPMPHKALGLASLPLHVALPAFFLQTGTLNWLPTVPDTHLCSSAAPNRKKVKFSSSVFIYQFQGRISLICLVVTPVAEQITESKVIGLILARPGSLWEMRQDDWQSYQNHMEWKRKRLKRKKKENDKMQEKR